MKRTAAFINIDNLVNNVSLAMEKSGGNRLVCAAVKANAYGHGAVPVSKHLLAAGVDCLGVACPREGIELRTAGITAPILVFSPPLAGDHAQIVESRLEPFVFSSQTVRKLQAEASAQKKTCRVHLKIDTGMGRIGCRPSEAADLAGEIAACGNLELRGTCTHFPLADSTREHTATALELFKKAVNAIQQAGIHPGILHAANSGALIGHPRTHLDMVRPGIMLYGYYPSRSQPRDIELKPVMSLVSKVSFIKKVEAGTKISYGHSFEASDKRYIATIACGYGDGLPRLLSNKGRVRVGDKQYTIAGRVCMDQTMLDMGPDCCIKEGADALLFGPGPGCMSAEDVAETAGTIPYEILCGITDRVERIYSR